MTDREVNILLVEDNQDDIELTLHALRRENLANKIFIVRDGEEALDFLFCTGPYAQRAPELIPRLILLDLKLPKISGLEVLQRIKADPRTQSIPVVILTSSREESDLVNGYRLGVNSYIQKPVDFDQFRDTVKKMGLYWLVINQYPISNGDKKAEVRHGERSSNS
ncbi:MAG TPA: response regulator [Terriglobales bacterium]|nr:response regulator [Terriglobales bacterium]